MNIKHQGDRGSYAFWKIYCCLAAQSYLTLDTPKIVAHQDPLSMRFPRQEYGVGCHFLPRGIFPTQGLNLHSHVYSLSLSHLGSLELKVAHYIFISIILHVSLIAQLVKNPPAMQETPVQFLSWEDSIIFDRKCLLIDFSSFALNLLIFTWKTPWKVFM